MTDPWAADGTWFRCALHAHTTRSDGELASRHLAGHYASAGPLLHDVRREEDAIEVRCSPCRSVTLVSGRATRASVNVGRLGNRHAGRELECDARKAWANPCPV